MKYRNVVRATFLNRPNRFIAYVRIGKEEAVAHVKNTGRCRELLIPGCSVYLEISDNPERKTKYDLICVEKKLPDGSGLLINMDSQAPNNAAEEWLHTCGMFSPNAKIRREVTYGNSRFDFCIEDGSRKCFPEVKGVTLEQNGTALFPDAPTERGVKHIHELIQCKNDGFEAYILFVIQMKQITEFIPNDQMHKTFGDALRKAEKAGVKIIAMDCRISPDSMTLDQPVNVCLNR